MKIFKYLILPINIICCCGNVGNTMEKQTQVSYYSMLGSFENILLSFKNDEILNDSQMEFIKKLCNDSIKNFDSENCSQIVHNNSTTCSYYKHNPNISECGTYCATIMFPTIGVIDTLLYNKIHEKIVTNQNITDMYHNLLNKIKQCYTENIIAKESYILLLQNLLYYNTNDIFCKLGSNTSKINAQDFNDYLYSLFIDTFETMEQEEFENNIDNKFYCGNISELQNSYKLYKLIMDKIIDDLIIVLVYDNYKVKKLKEKIFEPIISGLSVANWTTNPKYNHYYNYYEIDRCGVTPCYGIDMYQIMKLTKNINNNNQYYTNCGTNEKNQIKELYATMKKNTGKIDTEFNIKSKINASYSKKK